MAKDKNLSAIEALDATVVSAVASSLLPTIPAPEVASRMKETLFNRVKTSEANQRFMFADQGDWHTIAEGVQVKILRQESDSRSALVKMAANSCLPAHEHHFDEEAIVLEGDVWLEDILCGIGDYHLAQAGSAHREIRSEHGCLLFIRNA
ncbi:MAG: cupin domain-containing protein [Methylotenera sp.]|uniref:cupin domain-containing protein n=1 Tax=Methylotenera sp. TaxID=2051956 RepID=UPI0024893203|nr:cupin domain-containing protein [Methylotenera sp.]MDI1309504.1 cupin domain-containing protein [Methylotenera sp.]